MFVRNVPYPYKREINKPVFIKYLKSFNIGTIVHPCTVTIFALYTKCKYLVQCQKFDIATTERLLIPGLTIFAMFWFIEWGKT